MYATLHYYYIVLYITAMIQKTWSITWSREVSTSLPESTKPAGNRGSIIGSVVRLGFIGMVAAVIVYIHKKKLGWLLCFSDMF